MGNNSTKPDSRERTKKNVHWKSAEPPSPPGRPMILSPSDGTPDIILLKWDIPKSDGGSPIIGYFIEHRRTGSQHWVRAIPSVIPLPELTLSGLEPGWRYQFRIIAANIVGPSEPSELSETLTVTLQRNALTSPRFAKEIEDKIAIENEEIIFSVGVIGVPQPRINWYKDGFEVFSSRRTKIISENNTSKLIIHQAALIDEGEIKCSATNQAGHAVTRAHLRIEAPPKIRLPRQYEDGLLVEANDVVRLKISIAGRPSPNVIWRHNGEVIRNSVRHEITTTDKNSILKITKTQRLDRGEYQLKAINKLGEDSVSFLLTVTARPSPPGKINITGADKNIMLTWTAPIDDGGCKISNYIVEYFRIGWNVWLKAVSTKQLTATLNDLIEGSEYRFRVKAESLYGLSDPSEESETLVIPGPKKGITIKHDILDSTDSTSNKPKNTKETMPIIDRKNVHIDQVVNKVEQNGIDKKDKNLTSKRISVSPKPESSKQKVTRGTSPKKSVGVQSVTKEKSPNKNVEKISTDKLTAPTNGNNNALHSSNEYVLVLYDDKKDDADKKKENDLNLKFTDNDIPPPLSMSAPELGTEPPVQPILRSCASSTELLFEKAIQRMYQTLQMEEAKQANMKQTSQTLKAENIVLNEKKLIEEESFESYETPYQEDEKEETNSHLYTQDDEENEENEENEVDEDEENEDFDDRDIYKEMNESQKIIFQQQESAEYSDDYTESTASSTGSMDSLEKFIVAVKSTQMDVDQELETYHPKMESQFFLPGETDFTSNTTDVNSIDTDFVDNSEYNLPNEPVLPSEEIDFPKPLILPPSDFKPKPILKHPTHDIVPKPEKEESSEIANKVTIVSDSDQPKEIVPIEKPKSNNTEEKKLESARAQKSRLMMERRQSSIEENKVAIDHYSDIVNEIGNLKRYTHHKNLYENVDDLNTEKPEASPLKEILDNVKQQEVKQFTNDKDQKTINSKDTVPKTYSRSIFSIKLSKSSKNTTKEMPITEPIQSSHSIENETEINSIKSNEEPIESKVQEPSTSKLKQTEKVPLRKSGKGCRSRSTSRIRSKTQTMEENTPVMIEKVEKVDTIEKPTETMEETKNKIKSKVAYTTDLTMFFIACWLYLFKDPRLAVPFLIIMAYRQAVSSLKGHFSKWNQQ